MDLNNTGVLRHKDKTLKKNCHRAAFFQRIFFEGAHLTDKLFDDVFYEKTKVEVKWLTTLGINYKKEAKNAHAYYNGWT